MATSVRWPALWGSALLLLLSLACRGFQFQWSFTMAAPEATMPASGLAAPSPTPAMVTMTSEPAHATPRPLSHGREAVTTPTVLPTVPIQVQASVPQVFVGDLCGPNEPTVVHIQAQIAPSVPSHEMVLYFGYGQQAAAPSSLPQALAMFPVGEGRYQAEVDLRLDAPVLLDAPDAYDALYYQVVALDDSGNEVAASPMQRIPLRLCTGN